MGLLNKVVWVVLISTIVAGLVSAADNPIEGEASSQPQVVLVLSGGGARGAAHIGVLKVLEELRVPVDMVVGTSMGSIVGGLYASGWSPEDIETLLLEIDWAKVFSDRVDRSERTFRRKQDDYPYLIQTKLRFKGFKPYIPPSVLGGQRLELLMRSIEMESTGETDFDRFPIPYRAVACDIATGEAVIIDHGSLATAMRASMSVPAAFPPVELEGRRLIDGGSAANFPVGIAQDLGAVHVIGIDISSELDDEGLNSVFGVYGQLSSILVAGNRDEDVARIRDQDLLIVPALGDLSFIDFDRGPEAVDIGEHAARANAEALKRFAVSEEEYAVFQKNHRRLAKEAPAVDEVRLLNSSPVADEVIQRHLNVKPGEPLDLKNLEESLINLYNLDYFGTIRDYLKQEDGRRILVIETPKPRYGRASLQFGLSFSNDFDGDSRHAFTVRHRLLAVNRRGGEWQNIIQTGNNQVFGSEFYQPFDYGMSWFGAAYIESRETTLPLWSDGERVAEYRTDRNLARIEVGRILGNWGELRFGAMTSNNRGRSQVGAPIYPDLESNLSGLEVVFRLDTLDSVIFPKRGARITASYTQGLDAFGSDDEHERAFFSADGAFSWRGFSVVPGLEVGSNLDDEVSPFNLFQLGGFGRLSGLGHGELLGEESVLARVIVYQQIMEIEVSSAKIRVVGGITLEAGNVFQADDSITWDAMRYGGSIFIGADTSAGPIRLGWGYTDDNRKRISFSFGQSF